MLQNCFHVHALGAEELPLIVNSSKRVLQLERISAMALILL